MKKVGRTNSDGVICFVTGCADMVNFRFGTAEMRQDKEGQRLKHGRIFHCRSCSQQRERARYL